MSDTIHIIGAGAIGRALSVALQHHGRDVVLIRATVQDGQPTRENIRLLMGGQPDQLIEQQLRIFSLNHFKRFNGPLIVTSKSYGNQHLAEVLRPGVHDNAIVLLQNGLGVEQPFLQHSYPEIYRCVLFITSQITDGDVRLKPVAPSLIGVVKGVEHRLNDLVALLNTSVFAFAATNELQPVVWKKVIANSVFNSICPLLEVDNGIFSRQPDVRTFAERVVAECVQVAEGVGVTITEADVIKTILHISKSSDGQLISTLQDIRAKRKTEIDTLNLEIARIADQLGLSHVVATTRLLGELVALKSALNQ
jgi:2-dehydropantoate 2-reductase